MSPIYCTDCLDRIPFELFLEGKAAWSGGRPYLLKHAQLLGLKLDLKPPAEYAAAMGFSSSPPTLIESEKRVRPPAPATACFSSASPHENGPAAPRCELVIECDPDGVNDGHPPIRVDLLKHTSREQAVTLGRESSFTTVFKSNVRISRRHCSIWMADGRVFVKDLASSNKTFIDGIELLTQRDYPLFQTQILTMGAKHSAIRVTLEASGFPLTAKPCFASGVQMKSSGDMRIGTGRFRPPSRAPAMLQPVE